MLSSLEDERRPLFLLKHRYNTFYSYPFFFPLPLFYLMRRVEKKKVTPRKRPYVSFPQQQAFKKKLVFSFFPPSGPAEADAKRSKKIDETPTLSPFFLGRRLRKGRVSQVPPALPFTLPLLSTQRR